ncbi:MAG TPA: MopE-related protein [Candidatus Nanoarchaeia archaeon]|nr:MopE-related protein [Candidatus Nanoarchaeia archaeon]
MKRIIFTVLAIIVASLGFIAIDAKDVSASYCGDDDCNGPETCETCPADCGDCGGGGGGGDDDDGDGGGDDYGADCLGNTIPATMFPGESRSVSVTMKNEGENTWKSSKDYKLGSWNPENNWIWGLPRVYLPSGVEVHEGQQYTFTFTITAPSTPGSYPSFWKMVREHVTWFGESCGRYVTVQAVCTPGQTQTQPCGNCGSQTRTCQSNGQWGSYGVCTGQGVCSPGSSQLQGCGNCGTQTRTCQSTCQWGSYGTCNNQGPCSPGTTQTVSCDTGLPGICEEGEQSRTCQSSCQWGAYGTCVQINPPTTEVCNDEDDDCDGAEDEVCYTCIGDTIPTTMNTGQTQAVSVTVRNDGSVPWTAAANYRLGSQNPQDNVIWGLNRVLINPAVTVSENQQYTFNFNIVAPSSTGTYPNFWRMLKEGEFWFLPPNCGNDVTITAAPVCTPGQTQTQPCGNCGTQTRTCQSNGQWGSYGACTGQGPCGPGQQESRGCGTDVGECVAGTETRTCAGNCQWGTYQNCNAIGPNPEECDGLDNDCDNQIDDGFDPEDCEGSCEEEGFVWTGNGGLLDCCGNNPYEDDPYEQYETLCDGNDNDCDGEIDEGLTHPCTDYDDCSTFQTCDNCQNAPPEFCNGDDDDCDGQIDEGGVCDVDCELERISLRGKGGDIDFIDGYDDFASSKIKFSGWVTQNNDGSYYGIMSLDVQAKLPNGDNLRLRTKGKVADVNANNCGVLDVDNTWWSLATFQVGNNPPISITFDNIHYQWDRNTNLLDISGEGPYLDFSIEDIQINCVTC